MIEMYRVETRRDLRTTMFAYLTAEGRFLGFDRGDWALLIGGLAAVVLVTMVWT